VDFSPGKQPLEREGRQRVSQPGRPAEVPYRSIMMLSLLGWVGGLYANMRILCFPEKMQTQFFFLNKLDSERQLA
jgi:hypothetical protein